MRRPSGRMGATAVLLAAALLLAAPLMVRAQGLPADVLATLSSAQQGELAAYQQARVAYEAQASAYWGQIEAKRAARRQKKAAKQDLVAADYVKEMPPVYGGPQLSPALAKIVAELQAKEQARDPARDPDAIVPTIPECVQHARTIYNFTARQTSEAEFKRAYATEALAQGLTKDHVVRVYAFETGGKGTFDMQAGIDPLTSQGRAISTALGYAQLLAANSSNELVKHGPGFVRRLEEGARKRSATPARVRELTQKAAVVRAMLRDVGRVPNEWKAHRAFARTPKGLAVHTLNLDADIGPWLQVLKLKGLREDAAKAGVFTLNGAEIELMNLAGPGSGLEMMLPVTKGLPSANFFERGGYERNSIVRGRTAAGLLAEIEARMAVHLQKPGAVEFAAIFDAVAKRATGQ